MAALFLFSLLLAQGASAPAPRRPAPTVAQSAPESFEESRCLLGFCPLAERRGLPPGVLFLATGLVGVGLAGLAPSRGFSRGRHIP